MVITLTSVIDFPDKTVLANADRTVTCSVTGMSAETTVTWSDPGNLEISNSDTANYVLNEGNYIGGSKEYFLTIKKVGLLKQGHKYILNWNDAIIDYNGLLGLMPYF